MDPIFRFGYRLEFDNLAVDLGSNVGFSSHRIKDEHGQVNQKASVALSFDMGLAFFLQGEASHSPYLGATIGYSGETYYRTANSTNGYPTNTHYSGHGMMSRLFVGWEFFRASNLRFFIQADASLPYYTIATTMGDAMWNPTFMFSIGTGYNIPPWVLALGALSSN